MPIKELTGKHVLFIFLGMFAVVFSVNGLFLTKAITSFPGEVTKKSYMQGINYNESIKQRAIQNDLGWHAQIGLEADTSGNRIIAHILDEQNTRITHLNIKIRLNEHSNTHSSFERAMILTADNSYSVVVPEIDKGRWTATIEGHTNEGLIFQAYKELSVK